MPHKDPEVAKQYRKAHRLANLDHLRSLKRIDYRANRDVYLARARAHRMVNAYGITVAEYDSMFERQGGKCALCREPPGRMRLCVDHDHEINRVRGLLCIQCNSALGKLGDTSDALRRVIAYLDAEPDMSDVLEE